MMLYFLGRSKSNSSNLSGKSHPHSSTHTLEGILTPVFGLQQFFPQVHNDSHDHHVVYY